MTYAHTNNIVIYGNDYSQTGTWANPSIDLWVDRPTPKFNRGDTIVYLYYLKWSKKIAIHTIIDIRDDEYIFDSPYYIDEEYIMSINKTDKDFILLTECEELYPDLLLSGTRNGPKPGYKKEILKRNKKPTD